ncbi:MAG: hypothetical protein EA402_12690 [Planctomycetota bacterium]|nr:MAG: hypothetical protein EA402_12690 [Planctomycetota bacterium]
MGAEGQRDFIFQYAAGWHLYLALLACALLAWWAWRHYGPAPAGAPGRLVRGCRALALVAIIFALCGPAWRSVSNHIIPGRILVLVDASASMARADGPQDQPRILAARDLYQALAERLPELGAQAEWRAIGGVSGPIEAASISEASAVGSRSPLGDEILGAARAHPADLLLVLSDFRVTDGSSLDVTADGLRRLDLSAWALGVGGTSIDPELVVEEVEGSPTIALGERQPFTLRLSARGLDATQPLRVVVRDGEEVVAESLIEPDRFQEGPESYALEERLEVVLGEEGTRELRFSVEQGELRTQLSRQVEVSTRRLQVLMLAHRPRYEMRFLQVALRRDHSVDVHAYLADGRWRRWSPSGPSELPFTMSALRDYDVIIIGDIAPSALTAQAQSAIVTHVRENGAGLVWIPGETGSTALFHHEELGSLLPVTLPPVAELRASYLDDTTLSLRRTALARESALFEPGDTDWSQLPYLRRIARIDGVRDLARVWMEDEAERPAVVSAQFGNGTVVLIAVDDTWRWRRNVGDAYLHRFHSQILRFASRARASGARRWRIDASPYRVGPGETFALSVLPLGSDYDVEALPGVVTVELLREDEQRQLVEVTQVDGGLSGYRASVSAPGPGTWRLTMVDGLIPAEVAPGGLVVQRPSLELRDPRFDAVAMDQLVAGTGGRAFASAEDLVRALPVLSRERQRESFTSLWDSWWWLAAVVGLLSLEWFIRRWYRFP